MRTSILLCVSLVVCTACTPASDSPSALEGLTAPVAAAATPPVLVHVDDDAAPGGNGTKRLPFNNLPDAINYARTVSGDVIVAVAPGDYALGATLVIDRPLELRGSTEQLDGADSWPSGNVVPGTRTRVFASNTALTRLIFVGRGDGTVLSDVEVGGFVFEATTVGASVRLERVQDYRLTDNVFKAPATFGIESVASSGRVSGNHFSGISTGAVFTGGSPTSPSNVLFQNNRAVRNQLGGVLVNGSSFGVPEFGDLITAVIRDNDLSENVGSQGFGVRAFIIRKDLGAPGDSQSNGNVVATIADNRMVGNRMGVSIDAGFPYRQVGTTCDNRVYSGTMDLRFAGNTITGSLLTPALVTFTRNLAALNPSMWPQFQYLHNTAFVISDPDGMLAGARIDHRATDPFLGPCPNDTTHEVLDNVLIYNGQVLPTGTNF